MILEIYILESFSFLNMQNSIHFPHLTPICQIRNLPSEKVKVNSQIAHQQNHQRVNVNFARKRSIEKNVHMKINKFLMLMFGLWPYQSTSSRRRNLSIFVACIASLAAPYIQGFMETTSLDIIVCVGTIFIIIWMIGSLILSTALYRNEELIKELHKKFEINCDTIDKLNELTIIKTFTGKAGSSIFTFIVCGFIAASSFFILNYSPMMFKSVEAYDEIISTYSRRWIIHERLRRVQVIAHTSLIAGYCAMLYITALCVYLHYVQHICAVFDIVSQRLLNLTSSGNKIIHSKNTDVQIIDTLLDIIVMHREAMKSTNIVSELYGRIFYVLQVFALFILAILIFVIQISITTKTIRLAIRVIFVAVVFVQYIYIVNHGGQRIIDFSSKVFKATCQMSWDDLTPSVRKIVFMIMLQSYRPRTLTGGTVTLSMRNITKIMNTSWSLAAVLWSTQRNS